MAINVKSVAQFAELLVGKSTGVAAGKIGKNMVTYMKYGDEITKTVVRADGTSIQSVFKQIGGKYVPTNAVLQNDVGRISTNFLREGNILHGRMTNVALNSSPGTSYSSHSYVDLNKLPRDFVEANFAGTPRTKYFKRSDGHTFIGKQFELPYACVRNLIYGNGKNILC